MLSIFLIFQEIKEGTSWDDRCGLIFVANPEGIWILHQSLAEDPEIGMAYAHRQLEDR